MTDPDYPDSEEERLEAEAVTWIVRLMSGGTTESDCCAADSWRRQSFAHQQAFEKACRLWNGIEALRGPLIPPEQSGEAGRHSLLATVHSPSDSGAHSTQKWWIRKTIAAAIAVLALFFTLQSNPLTNWMADFSTGTGEQATRKLMDGSVVQLNTQAALNLVYSPKIRRVDLLEGEAAFRVAKDPSRPFIVQTDYGTIRAVGTEFLVYKREDSVLVTVIEGVVDVSVSPRQGRSNSSARLGTGQRVQFDNRSGLREVEQVDLRMVTAWQHGKLIFESTPLTKVVEEMNRYRPGYIVILNDTLRHHQVNGAFNLEKLNSAVTAIERTLPITSLRLSDWIIFLQ